MKKLLFLLFFIGIGYVDHSYGNSTSSYQKKTRTRSNNRTYYKSCNKQGRMASSECLNNTPLGLMNDEMKAEYRDFPN